MCPKPLLIHFFSARLTAKFNIVADKASSTLYIFFSLTGGKNKRRGVLEQAYSFGRGAAGEIPPTAQGPSCGQQPPPVHEQVPYGQPAYGGYSSTATAQQPAYSQPRYGQTAKLVTTKLLRQKLTRMLNTKSGN